jgi:hypothetical protein
LNHVPTAHQVIGDPLGYYRKHYAGLTRGELKKKDQSLYSRLLKDGLLSDIPTANLSALAKKRSRFGLDALAYYKKHYQGLTRGELSKKDKGLYDRLWRDGLLNDIPTGRRLIGDPLEYYRKHYAGLTREEVWRKNKRLYNTLWLDGTLKYVPQRGK